MNNKMREALELAREAIESHYPSHREYKLAAALIALAEQPAQGEAVGRQYYYRVSDCPAKEAADPNCICWHDAGTGPCKTAREADRDSFGVCLKWRDKPAPLAPSDSVPMPQNADQAALMTLLGEDWLRNNAPERLKQHAQGKAVGEMVMTVDDLYRRNVVAKMAVALPVGTKLYTAPPAPSVQGDKVPGYFQTDVLTTPTRLTQVETDRDAGLRRAWQVAKDVAKPVLDFYAQNTAEQPAQGEAVGWYKVFSGEASLVPYSTFLPEDALPLGWQKVFLLAPPAPIVPEGWKLVPVEPTHEMINGATGCTSEDISNFALRQAWCEMLAAAPVVPRG